MYSTYMYIVYVKWPFPWFFYWLRNLMRVGVATIYTYTCRCYILQTIYYFHIESIPLYFLENIYRKYIPLHLSLSPSLLPPPHTDGSSKLACIMQSCLPTLVSAVSTLSSTTWLSTACRGLCSSHLTMKLLPTCGTTLVMWHWYMFTSVQ